MGAGWGSLGVAGSLSMSSRHLSTGANRFGSLTNFGVVVR